MLALVISAGTSAKCQVLGDCMAISVRVSSVMCHVLGVRCRVSWVFVFVFVCDVRCSCS